MRKGNQAPSRRGAAIQGSPPADLQQNSAQSVEPAQENTTPEPIVKPVTWPSIPELPTSLRRALALLTARQVSGLYPGMDWGTDRIPARFLIELETRGLALRSYQRSGSVFFAARHAPGTGNHLMAVSLKDIELNFPQSRALDKARQYFEVGISDRTRGRCISYLHLDVLVGLGLLRRLDRRSFAITEKGRAYLDEHPHDENPPIVPLSKRLTPEEKALNEQEYARGQLALIDTCGKLGQCLVCLGTGHRQPGRNRWEKIGAWQHFETSTFECPACAGTGRAPQTDAYRDLIESARAKFEPHKAAEAAGAESPRSTAGVS